MTLAEFRQKYGTRTPGLLVEEFVRRAPAFPGDGDLARALAQLVADLESVELSPGPK